MKKEFHSKGKLLLTGEYVVLDGAEALALPTKKGQSLTVETNDTGILKWKSYDCYKKLWYQTEIATNLLFENKPPKGNSKFDETLFAILWHAFQLNPLSINAEDGFKIETHLEFERLWGLGTSSTLINNISKWISINPFELLNKSFGGSGYDIAAANAVSPIVYQRTKDSNFPTISSNVEFHPNFTDQLFFIYLEEKKDSKEAIKSYRSLPKEEVNQTITEINQITSQIINCKNLSNFERLLESHENIISKLLQCKTIKKERFYEFSGVIKSLGAWGGDFVLATGDFEQMRYFSNKGYRTIIPYSEMIF